MEKAYPSIGGRMFAAKEDAERFEAHALNVMHNELYKVYIHPDLQNPGAYRASAKIFAQSEEALLLYLHQSVSSEPVIAAGHRLVRAYDYVDITEWDENSSEAARIMAYEAHTEGRTPVYVLGVSHSGGTVRPEITEKLSGSGDHDMLFRWQG